MCEIPVTYSDVCNDPLALNYYVLLTSFNDGLEQNMLVPHSALKGTLQSIEEYSSNGFIYQPAQSVTWTCFHIVVSYCAYIFEAKPFLTVEHGLSI